MSLPSGAGTLCAGSSCCAVLPRASGEPLFNRKPRSSRPFVLALLAGIALGLSFPPYGVAPLGWLVVGLLVLAVRSSASQRQAVAVGVLAGATVCALGYHWIAQTAHDFGLIPWPGAIAAWAVFALIGELNLTLFAWGCWLLRKPLGRGPAVATAALFSLIEFLTPKVFPDVLAHSHLDVPWFASASALVGQFGLGFVMAWTSMAVFEAVRLRLVGSERRRFATAEALLAVVVVVLLTSFGAVRQRRALDIERTLDVVLVQTNVGDPIGLVNAENHIAVIDSLVGLYVEWTREALDDKPADFVVWPETAVPAGTNHGVYYHIQRLAIETNTPVVFGGYDFQRSDEGIWNIYNTLYWIDTQGTIRDRYYKNRLIPIGEAIPFESRWPQLRRLVPNAGEFHAGPGPAVMEVDGIATVPLICYELIFPRYVRQALHRGGKVLLNVSNDYWFGRSAEPLQHLTLARMRAYETGRPIIRCTNTGISALVDSRGKVTHRSGIWKRETLRGTIDVPRMEWTPYARWGEWTTLVLIVSMCALAWGMARLRSFRP